MGYNVRENVCIDGDLQVVVRLQELEGLVAQLSGVINLKPAYDWFIFTNRRFGYMYYDGETSSNFCEVDMRRLDEKNRNSKVAVLFSPFKDGDNKLRGKEKIVQIEASLRKHK